ncbi:MAG TPA: histidine phosphatase family protein [Elusimicrobiota bacterium]|nr:histidine phosphatase family protein [Elusimicrobiota bacterium]
MPTHIVLIRHGETDWNRLQRIQGHQNVPLSPLGEQQAGQVGRRLRQLDIAAAYASDLDRAARTADIALADWNGRVVHTDSLRERCFGEWEGRLWPEIEKTFPTDARRFHEDPVGFSPPGGESWNQMQERVFNKIEGIARDHPDQTVAVFTSGGPCKAAILAALGLPAGQWRLWVAGNASLHRLWHAGANGNGTKPWRLLSFNDVAHLEPGRIFSDPSANLKEKVE